MRYEQNTIIFKTPFGWAGVAVSEQGISRVVLPKKSKLLVERELKSSGCRSPFTPTGSTELADVLSLEGKWGKRTRSSLRKGLSGISEKTIKHLQQYFSGKRVSFDLPFDLRYYTTFQQAVWRATVEIPYGETRSYGWIAERIGNPKAVRAVGQAMGANPLPIIVP
jgi:methylated-DNA-[protein]-cysteine S-methyltransferase